MGSTNISLKKEAYEYLKSIKSIDESFSDAVLKLKQERKITGSILVQSLANHTPPDNEYFKKREKELKTTRQRFEQEFTK